jgi:hypothetical protein
MGEIYEGASNIPLTWVGCDCDDPVTEVNILFLTHYNLTILSRWAV